MGWLHTLRGKLIVSTILVEAVIIGAVLWNGLRLTEAHLLEQFDLRRKETTLLLDAALAPAMAQRDYAAVSDILQATQAINSIDYLVMFDNDGQIIATANWDRRRPLPATDNPARLLDGNGLQNFDLRIPMSIGGRQFGELQYGLDLGFLRQARDELQRQTMLIAISGLLLSALVLASIGLWLTRHLNRLTQASRRLARGATFQTLPNSADDDVGALTRAFNQMGGALAARVGELLASEREQRQLAATLSAEQARLHALLSSMRLGLLFVSPEGRVVYANPAFRQLWRLEEDDTPAGMTLGDLVQRIASDPQRLPDPYQREHLFLDDGLQWELRQSDERLLTQTSVAVPAASGQTEEGESRLWIFEDITHERQTADRLLFMAERDPLTGLYNRSRFEGELQRLAVQLERDTSVRAALLYFDLDEFKTVNDSFGHRAGDAVLLRIAGEVGQLLRGNEMFARLGGDEFAVVAPGADLAAAQTLAQRIISAVAALGFEFEGTKVRLTSSLGIALLPEHARRPEEWVARADIAMYAAKHAGKNGWRVFREELGQSAYMLAQLSWAERIQAALEQDLFELHFQGIYTTGTPVLSHLEVLLRMKDPEHPGQYLMPGEFIPAAERNGRILDIDRWVLAAGIRTLARRTDLPGLAINISGRSFDDPGLPDYITGLLETHRVAPQRLLVELTETAALSNMADTQRFISHIRSMGGSVCLDDFGVGFSSFAYLKHLDADVIKIDGMFIRNLVQSREDQVFVRAIIEVARGLGKKTVAEFVEDRATYLLLGELGVDLAQGYHLSRPRPELPDPAAPPAAA